MRSLPFERAGGVIGFARFGVLKWFVARVGGVTPVANALFDAIGRVLQGKRVEDICLDMDVSKDRVVVAIACSEQNFTFSAGQDGDEVRFVAAVAEDFSDCAGVCVPLHVGLTGAMVDGFAGWFTSDPKSLDEVGRRGGSPKCVAVEYALVRFGSCRGKW